MSLVIRSVLAGILIYFAVWGEVKWAMALFMALVTVGNEVVAFVLGAHLKHLKKIGGLGQ